MINQPTFKVTVKSLKCFKEASRIAHFYDDVGRDLSQPNMRFNQVINNFIIQPKPTGKKSKEEAEKDDLMTAQICEALISFSNGNKPPKANRGTKNDAMVSQMKL